MSKKYSLVLTDSFEKLEKTENILTLKSQISNFGRDIKLETVSFPEISKKEIYDRYNFCEKIFNSLLRDLVIELNSIHKIDYSQRSWACLLAGVGTFPREENLTSADPENAQALQDDLKYVDNFIDGCSLNFEPHENMLTSRTP